MKVITNASIFFIGLFVTLAIALAVGAITISSFKDACYWSEVGTKLDNTQLVRNTCTGAVR